LSIRRLISASSFRPQPKNSPPEAHEDAENDGTDPDGDGDGDGSNVVSVDFGRKK